MIVRELPFEEWDRLEGLPFAANGLPDPSGCRVLVAEAPDGAILGVWSLMSAVFLEGLWVRPDQRGHSTVAGRLLLGMKQFLAMLGIQQAFTMTQAEAVKALALKAGFRPVPGDVLVLQDDPPPQLVFDLTEEA